MNKKTDPNGYSSVPIPLSGQENMGARAFRRIKSTSRHATDTGCGGSAGLKTETLFELLNMHSQKSRIRTFPSARLLLALCVAMAVRLSPANAAAVETVLQDAEPMVWFRDAVDTGNAARWYRLSFMHTPSTAAVRLTFAADGVSSVYVNGQRLLKQVTLPVDSAGVTAAGFDVTSLLRNGRNCVALERRHSLTILTTAVGLTTRGDGQAAAALSGEWKAVAMAPPVGWQQTDFNDRDWVKVEPQATAPADSFAVRSPLEWQPASVPASAARVPFEWRDGDHVVLLGATFLEREQQYGHVEALLSASAGARRVTFRNLGWDGDTVFAESRGIFDSPDVGYQRMIEHVRAEEPTVIVVCYGQNEALSPGQWQDAFRTRMRRLLDDLSSTGATIVLLSPHELLPAERPVPGPSRFNPRISAAVELLRSVAEQHGTAFVNLFQDFTAELIAADGLLQTGASGTQIPADPDLHPDLWAAAAARWTDNGMHFNNVGYQAVALVVRQRLLGIPAQLPKVQIDAARRTVSGTDTDIRNVVWNGDSQELVRFEIRAARLAPLMTVVELTGDETVAGHGGTVDSNGRQLPLRSAGTAANAEQSSTPQRLILYVPPGPEYSQLVAAIVRKNELYFHRWRPQNITYLFGFRKHEQGNNAVEIAQFDPLVKELEDQIQNLQQATWRTVVISAAKP